MGRMTGAGTNREKKVGENGGRRRGITLTKEGVYKERNFPRSTVFSSPSRNRKICTPNKSKKTDTATLWHISFQLRSNNQHDPTTTDFAQSRFTFPRPLLLRTPQLASIAR